MNINNRLCNEVVHNQVQVTHLCIFENCNLIEQQCCYVCINEGIHNHGQSNNEHIIEQEIQNIYQKLPQLDNDNDKDVNQYIGPIDLQNRKYNLKQIYGDLYSTSQISNNEKYVAFGGYEKILNIYDIKEDRIIKKIKCDGYLFVGCKKVL